MITISEHLIVTKELNEVVCRYAQKVLLKDFLLQFTFPKSRNGKIKITTNNINSLLEELKNDSDRLNKIKASLSDKDTVAVCLDCGDKSDNLGVCNCGCARVVSRKVAESLINKLECSNETVATE